MRRRRTEIIIETDELLILRPHTAPRPGWCVDCGSEVEMVTPETAAIALRASRRSVYRLIESGVVHFFETAGGELFICARSLTPRQ